MNFGIGTNVVIVHVNSLNKKDPPTALTVLAVNVLQYRTNCLNATPMFEYRATGTAAAVAMT